MGFCFSLRKSIGKQSCALLLLSSLPSAPKLDRNSFMKAMDRIEKPNLGVDGGFLRFFRRENKIMRAFCMKNGDSGPAYKSIRSASSFSFFTNTLPVYFLPKSMTTSLMGSCDRDHCIQKHFPRFPSYVALSTKSLHFTKRPRPNAGCGFSLFLLFYPKSQSWSLMTECAGFVLLPRFPHKKTSVIQLMKGRRAAQKWVVAYIME